MENNKCKICRRVGIKLFLKGERCFSTKCAMIKRAFPPGERKKRRPRPLSGYGKGLKEKQKLRNWYNLKENQFKKYVKEILSKKEKKEDPSLTLIKKLENRLDNVIFRMGLASSREKSRQLVLHRHFLVNGRRVNVPSFEVRKGDVISIFDKSKQKNVFKDISNLLKKYQPPSWIKLDINKLEGEIIGEPSLEEASLPVEVPLIFEFYSK